MWKIPVIEPNQQALSSPLRYVTWLARKNSLLLTAAVLTGMVSFLAPAVRPFVIGNAFDTGLERGITPELLGWAGIMLASGLIQVIASGVGHRIDVLMWLRAALTTARLLGRKSASAGEAITVELPTGEVVSSVTGDAHRIGDLYFQAATFIGSVATYVAVSIYMFSASLKLGLILSLGLPTVAAILAFLVRPLQKKQELQREVTGRLTSLGSDTVTGLRILRGIGGESVFVSRYRDQSKKVKDAGVGVARVQANMDGLQVLLPGLFVSLIMFVGAREALSGAITPGQLITFYGYAAFLTWPMQNLISTMQIATRTKVAATRVLKVLAVNNRTPDTGTVQEIEPSVSLTDVTSGVVLEPGTFTALVAADPDASAAIATRMSRFDDAAEAETPVTLGQHMLKEFNKATLRHSVVLSEATPHIFSGTLRDTLVTRETRTDEEVLEALTVSDAHDVLTSLPQGLDSELPEKGRSLSGGQRQRVSLARALLTKADHLILIEPTSAVDAHTESRIGKKLKDYRKGQATLVVTASPLVLEHADTVIVLDNNGEVAGTGTHHELLNRSDDLGRLYGSIVGRELDNEAPAQGEDGAKL